MIVLCGRDKIDYSFDKIWFATHTCPGMGPGCEHHPELAASEETFQAYYASGNDSEVFASRFREELESEPLHTHLVNLVKLSDAGEWIQLVFYELDPQDGERKYMYDVLRNMTKDVMLE